MSLPRPRPGLPRRSLFFWLHLVVGFVAGFVILTMSLTGVALTYEPQIVDWMESGYHRAPLPGEERRPLTELAAPLLAEAGPGHRVESVIIDADPTAPLGIRVSDAGTTWVDPYNGEVLGAGAVRTRAAFGWITRFHRWFALSGDARGVARAITGASNLAFLFLLVSGLYLWWPRKASRRAFRAILRPQLARAGRVRDFNWHHVAGFWLALPLFVVVASATVFYYGWANDLAYRMVGDVRPAPSASAERAEPLGPGPRLADVDAHLEQAVTHLPEWRRVTVSVPEEGESLHFRLDAGTGGQPQKRATLELHAASGELVAWEPFESLSRGRRFRSMLRFAHTGEAWGFIGQTLAGLASLAGAILVWTGIALGLRRLRTGLRRDSAGPDGGPEAVDADASDEVVAR